MGSNVKASVRASLKNVGWEEALRTVLRADGLDYIEEGGIIRVDEASKLQTEMVDREAARAKAAEVAPLETRIVKLNFANATELSASLQSSLTRRGSITVD
jgi:type IV pilus assembly protein PilQ